eukprot:CAMPEP_0196189198 /NCGR_PEP_ID=MMETSP0911-20130528/43814_1 /TAXON_ID=49265 /ORGANISM="Thalassiosira rotula, Strain GSO102" /LENGTH=88 /DNA_ID=CAMNT_0041460737 /DNA_START=177 /DNA_END=443 /DNA_ORIENTATION=+
MKETDRVLCYTYHSLKESLATISVVMTLLAWYMGIDCTSNLASDKPPPTEEVEVSQEDSEISSLASPNIPEGENGTAEVVSKVGDQKE